jgi:hypothetical protein
MQSSPSSASETNALTRSRARLLSDHPDHRAHRTSPLSCRPTIWSFELCRIELTLLPLRKTIHEHDPRSRLLRVLAFILLSLSFRREVTVIPHKNANLRTENGRGSSPSVSASIIQSCFNMSGHSQVNRFDQCKEIGIHY